ncbi:hypothetical protein C1Y40_00008 [Mycobacterium talmoniae]|uniref:Uncharacterized protein n=1 Tax=Mycobacterium talmoniae TaxID=1858794 RepID=A0A2S8BSZ2_9MYCO|nr:hypothetical protein C1Y40_00008 [Mycobacterium talmoniae]
MRRLAVLLALVAVAAVILRSRGKAEVWHTVADPGRLSPG